MNKKEEISYLDIIPIKCDCCGEMTDSYSDKSEWFGKYLKPEEERICRKCIKNRPGYAEEFKETFGLSMEDGMATSEEISNCDGCINLLHYEGKKWDLPRCSIEFRDGSKVKKPCSDRRVNGN